MTLIELSTNGKLDAVLGWLNQEFINDRRTPGIHIRAAGCRNKHEISLGVSFFKQADHIYELDLILEYLCEVEHCIRKQGEDSLGDCYRIEYKGMILIEQGGYDEQKRLLIERQTWDDQIASKGVENSTTLNNLTTSLTYAGYAAAVGTGLLFLMELVKYFHLFEQCYCH